MDTWCNVSHVSNFFFLKGKKKDKKKKRKVQRKKKRKGGDGSVCERREKKDFRERSSSFSIRFTEIGLWVFVGAKAKSVHASRATRGYQCLGVSSNSTR